MPLDAPFTSAQAHAAGITRKSLEGLVQKNLVRRVLRGVYAAAQAPDSRAFRGAALGLVAPESSVVCDWTAAWFWTGLDRPGTHLGQTPPLSVYRFRGHERLRNPLVTSGERWFSPVDVVPLNGRLSVSTPLRTAWDLGRFSPRLVAIGGMDALLRTGHFTLDELLAGVERFRRQRGVVQLRHLAPMLDPLSESPGESALRLRWMDVPALPRPECQIGVAWESGAERFRLDMGCRRLLLAAEYDGEAWHDSETQREHDERRRAVLRDEFGWHVEVFRRHDVFGQHETVTARLQQALQLSRSTLHRRRSGPT